MRLSVDVCVYDSCPIRPWLSTLYKCDLIWFDLKDYLYWSDWEAQSILQVDKLRANEDGSVKRAVLHLYSPMDVQVYHKLKQPPAESESPDACDFLQ